LIHYEVNVPPEADLTTAEQLIEECCESRSLQQTLKGTLSKHSGCTHYHYKKGKERGTLEITLWPKEHRIWISIQSGRAADWIAECVEQLKEEVENKLATN
jgi:hypothetical protein